MTSTYNQICPVIFGAGAVKQLGEKVKELGASRAFCVCDQGVKLAGIADKTGRILENAGIEYVIYEGIQADPTDIMINAAAEKARIEKTDIVIGIGGGSSLDAAKAIAVLLKNEGKIGAYYAGGKPFRETAPLILIPTASGTGSEVTPMAVITDTESQAKQTVLNHGDIALVDPELTLTVPAHVTAATGFDALSHAVEAFTAKEDYANPLSDVLALKAMTLISDNLETAYLDGGNLTARENLSQASNFAGIAFAASSVHIGHVAAHELGARYHIPHGAVCALALPETIRFAARVRPEKMFEIAQAMETELPQNVDGVEAGEILAEEIRKRMRKLQMKALRDYGITKAQTAACAGKALENNWFSVCAPDKVDEAVMEEFLIQMYENY